MNGVCTPRCAVEGKTVYYASKQNTTRSAAKDSREEERKVNPCRRSDLKGLFAEADQTEEIRAETSKTLGFGSAGG